ncbi:MAG TPA: DUF4386 family protein [Caldilineaceae bacterium]|nr:DUF4386 family protein [Caldilineaceae bacterium]
MTTNIHTETRMRSIPRQNAAELVGGPDPAWRGLYKIGGILAIVYMVGSLIVPAVMLFMKSYDFNMDAATLLTFIAENRLWWIVWQGLILESSILLIVTYVALFVALKHLNNAYAAIGAIVGSVTEILFMAYYPILLGLVYLSDQYVTAADAQKTLIAAAAEGLLAQNNAFNPVYEPLFAASILIFSLVMLKGVFPKSIAYLGIATFVACFVGMALWPIIGVGYFWWWFFALAWFIAVGWKLYQLGR